MELYLYNFRKHEEKKVSFSSFTLLKGSSGQGKSTLFQAFYWCLYGSVRCVYPSNCPKVQTKVICNVRDLVITRSRNPKFLQVVKNKKKYKDVEAQGIIDGMFGTKEVWLATSYLSQGQTHVLLEKNNTASFELLNSLAFSGEDPRLIINKLKTLCKEKEDQLAPKLERIQQLGASLEARDNLFENKNRRTKEQLDKLVQEVEEKKKALPELQKKALKEKELEGRKKSIQNEIEKITHELSLYKEVDIEKIEKKSLLCTERDLAVEYWKTLSVYNSLSQKIKQDAVEVKGDLYKLSAYLDEYNKQTALASALSIPYEEQAIREEKERLRKNISRLLQAEEKNKLRTKLLTQLSKLLPAVKLNANELQEEIFALKELIKHREKLTCPYCDKQVSYWQGKLIKREIEEEVAGAEKKLKEKEALLVSAKEEEQKKAKRKAIQQQLKSLEEEDCSRLAILRDRLSKLEKLEYLEKPQYTKKDIETAKIKAKLPQVPPEQRKVEDIERDIQEVQKLLDKHKQHRKQKKLRDSLQKDLDGIVIYGLEEKLVALTERISNLEKEISLAEISNSIHRDYEEFCKLDKEYEKEYEILLGLNNLLKNALAAERIHLENVVQTCNYVLDKATSSIFEEPIQARLQLEKQLKSGVNKHKVNFYLNYRGMEGEIDQLSGGEKQRMSLALLLALSQFSNSPLLLDECLAYLDSDLQESSLEIIREFAQEKEVIYIGHNMTEGHFSSIIEL